VTYEGLEVPKKTPRLLIRHDEISRVKREVTVHLPKSLLSITHPLHDFIHTHIGRGDCITVPWDTKHAVARALDDERVRTLCTVLGLDDVLYATVAAIAARNA
jgi:hypothetical protein